MKAGLFAVLVLGTFTLGVWSVPLNSVFVKFPGDIIKNLTNKDLAEVSQTLLILLKCLD